MQCQPIGLVDNERFTPRAKEVYQFLWAWSVMRFEGAAAVAQEKVYQQHGVAALNRRFARVNRIIDRLTK